jgi:hypothetical protein
VETTLVFTGRTHCAFSFDSSNHTELGVLQRVIGTSPTRFSIPQVYYVKDAEYPDPCGVLRHVPGIRSHEGWKLHGVGSAAPLKASCNIEPARTQPRLATDYTVDDNSHSLNSFGLLPHDGIVVVETEPIELQDVFG